MEEGDGLRTRSFRNEDYNTRRAFLTSYPLHFDNDEVHQETQARTTTTTKIDRADTNKLPNVDKNERVKMKKEAMKKTSVTIVQWIGGRVVVLRKFKCKVSFYAFSCFPIVFKPSKALVSSS